MMEKEIWKDIDGTDRYYEVSNFGNVRTYKRSQFHRRATPINKSAYKMKNGYLVTSLSKNGKSKKYLIHRIVAEAFIPNPENKPEVNHIDGNKENNRVDNLEWATHSYNLKHASENNLMSRGENHVHSKLSKSQVEYIKALLKYTSCKQCDIADHFNVSKQLINDINMSKTWNHVIPLTETQMRRYRAKILKLE